MSANCIFCKIVKGAIPSMKLVETELSIESSTAKHHAEKMHELPDEYLRDILPVAKKIALASGAENYNILQNNGRLAHQEVPHVHFHYIPKPSASDKEGLGIGWPAQTVEKDELQKIYEEIKRKL
ncbi:Adenosine 5'-monophosphoramidase [Dispira simplex]|nr:Adenosine 5'-monophosphoramidase [Dispira simplex]